MSKEFHLIIYDNKQLQATYKYTFIPNNRRVLIKLHPTIRKCWLSYKITKTNYKITHLPILKLVKISIRKSKRKFEQL